MTFYSLLPQALLHSFPIIHHFPNSNNDSDESEKPIKIANWQREKCEFLIKLAKHLKKEKTCKMSELLVYIQPNFL
jgi:hypothetical protein